MLMVISLSRLQSTTTGNTKRSERSHSEVYLVRYDKNGNSEVCNQLVAYSGRNMAQR